MALSLLPDRKLVLIAFQKALRRIPQQPRTLLFTIAFGLAGGLASVAFAEGAHFIFDNTIEKWAHNEPIWRFLLFSFISMTTTGLISGWLLVHYCPGAAGSGIPQLKQAFWERYGLVKARDIWVKFLAGVLTVGSGGSMGREGPSVFIAGGIASRLSRLFGAPTQALRHATAAGAAAGLSAAFNTPLAAITFVLEEIIDDMNSRHLGAVILASVVGALTVFALVGADPAFDIQEFGVLSGWAYLIVAPTAAISALVGVLFQKISLDLRRRRAAKGLLPGMWGPLMANLSSWAIGVVVFLLVARLGVFGLGYHDLNDALDANIALGAALLLLFGKLLATSAAYGFGGCGGIFAPTLFFGAMSGIACARLGEFVMPLSHDDVAILAVVGMSACLGAVVRAPITSILIVFEMTHQFNVVPALMLGTLVSQLISRSLNKSNFYTEVLEQDGVNLRQVKPPRDLKGWIESPVANVFKLSTVVLRDLSPETLQLAVDRHNSRWFAVMDNGKFIGVLSRGQAKAALEKGFEPKVFEAHVVSPMTRIGTIQELILESDKDVVVVQNPTDGELIGLLTPRDILNKQMALAEMT